MATGADDLFAWIDALRGRVARGELDGRGRVTLGDGAAFDAALAARILLADYDHGDDLTPEQRRNALNVERRRVLLADLRRLREQIGYARR